MQKNLFSSLIMATALVMVLASCKKDSGSSNDVYQFTAKFDGTEKTFSVLTSAAEATPDGLFSLTLIGIGATESITLNLWSDKEDFVAGKIFSGAGPSGKENIMAYGPNGSTDTTSYYFSTYAYGSVTEDFFCDITATTTTGYQGTFSGTLYKNEAGIPQKIIVTDGTFYAKK